MTEQRPDALKVSRHTVWSLFAVILGGLTVTAVFFWTAWNNELNRLKVQFEHDANIRANLIAEKLDQCLLVIRVLQGYYNASDLVERREFTIFTAPFLAERKELQAVAWLPRVLQTERDGFEKWVRQEGVTDFQIKDLTPDRRFISADKREEYYPIEYVEPLKGNEIKFGFNMASEPIRRAALEKARDTGQAAVTERIQMMQDDDAFGFIIYLPIYRKAVPASTVHERRAALEGFVAGIFRTDDALAAAMNVVMPEGISYNILDLTEPSDRQLICYWSSQLKGEWSWKSPFFPSLPCYPRKIDFGDRRWEMNITANSAFVDHYYSLLYWLIPPAGIGLTLLLGLYLSVILSQRTIMERTVLERTAELRQYQENLEEMVELRAAELRKLSVAVEQNPAIIVITDQEGNIEYANPKFSQTTGYTLAEVRGKNLRILKSGKTTPEEYQALWDTIRSGREWRGVFYNKKKNGDYYWEQALIAPIKNDNGIIANFIAIKEDITDRKRAEEALRESDTKYRTLVENLPQKVFLKDENSIYVSCNKNYAQDFKIQPDEITGKTDYDFYPAELAEKYRADDKRIMETGETEDIEEKYVLNGQEFWVNTVKTPVRNERSNIVGVLGIFHDITQHKWAEKALKMAHDDLANTNLELKKADEIKSRFLATMSHEIRTPLNAIIGMTGLLLDTKLDAEQQDCAETVRTSGEMLLALINNILDFSKIEAEKMDLENQPFDLRQCVEESLDLVNQRAEEKRLEIGYQMQKDLPSFFVGDVTRLRQILVNLLSNAVKFTDKGEVTMSVSGELRDNGLYQLHFVVRDTGLGIPPDSQDQLFLSFSQVDASTSRRFGGTGLGLAISKRLCEMMGGKMWVESSGIPGEGAVFHFTILAAMAAEPLPRETTNVANLAGNHLRILLAEDNLINQRVALKILAKMGYRADTASNGLEVLEAIKRIPYDVILMDCQMPEMDGYEAARQIRLREQAGRQKPVYIIAMTAYAMKGDREECLAAGMNDYLSKPFREADLRAALQQCRPDGLLGDRAKDLSMPQPVLEQPSVTGHVTVDEEASPALMLDTPAVQPDEHNVKRDSPIFVDTKIGTVPDEQLLDMELLEEGAKMGSDSMCELIEMYLTQAKEIMADLRTAIAAGAAKDVKQLAHKLAGSSAVCGIKAIVSPLRALEQQGKEGRLSGADQLLAQASLRLELSEKALADYLQDLRDH